MIFTRAYKATLGVFGEADPMGLQVVIVDDDAISLYVLFNLFLNARYLPVLEGPVLASAWLNPGRRTPARAAARKSYHSLYP